MVEVHRDRLPDRQLQQSSWCALSFIRHLPADATAAQMPRRHKCHGDTNATAGTSGMAELGTGREGESGNSNERKRRKKKSLKAQVNYCCAYSVPFMWGEGLV